MCINIERPSFVCAESGIKFQFPDGAMCRVCKRMVSTPYYLYVDMEPTCLKCRQVQVREILKELKASIKK